MVSHLNSLGKREGRHKRIQAVSPSILLARGRSEWRDSTLLFSAEFSLAEKQGLDKQNLESFLAKEEQEERWVERNS